MNERVDPMNSIALSSQVRLARNFADIPFSPRMQPADYERVIERTEAALCGEHYTLKRMAQLRWSARECMMEAQLIRPELAQTDEGALLLNEDKTVAVMLGEEDHLRVQAVLPGLQLGAAMQLAERVEHTIERERGFAFDRRWGYLTVRPDDAGTGLHASVTLHLAALYMLGRVDRVVRALPKKDFEVRGVYGAGNDACGQIYQLSNRVTLGRTEEEILEMVGQAADEVMKHERAARKALLENDRLKLEDKLMRSYGILLHARLLSLNELMDRLSSARLAADLGLIDVTQAQLSSLMIDGQPATLERIAGHRLEQRDGDVMRAQIVQRALA